MGCIMLSTNVLYEMHKMKKSLSEKKNIWQSVIDLIWNEEGEMSM